MTAIAAIASLLVGCGGSTKPQSEVSSNTQSDTVCITTTRTMKRSVEDVRTLRTREEYEAMIAHYWDDFDFECGAEVAQYDTTDMLQAMSDYVLFIPRQSADSLLRSLMVRASQSREVLNFFTMLTEEVLHNPNSPLRNDEYYIPVLETILASPLLDEYDRIAPAYDLEIAYQNRIGCAANDFVYTLANGRTGRLHGIGAEYTILMFSNPGCPMCAEIIDEICREMQRLQAEPITDDELHMVRNYMTGEICRNYESAFALADAYIFIHNLGLPTEHIEHTIEAIRTTDATRLQQLAQRYLHPEKLHCVVVGA